MSVWEIGEKDPTSASLVSPSSKPIANMATISRKRGSSVATVPRGWLLCLPVPLLERL